MKKSWSVLESQVGQHFVAFDASTVAGVRHEGPAATGRLLLDLARVFGCEAPTERRTVLTFDGDPGFDVLVGTAVAFREVAQAQLLKLPELVAALGPRSAVMGLVSRDRGYSLLMDSRGLGQWVTQGGPSE